MISYETCKRMKELGLRQKHDKYSKYYVSPDLVIDFETAHDIFDANSRKPNDVFEEIEWTKSLVYIPTLEDLVGQQSYELTLDAAVHAFMETHSDESQELLKRTEDAVKEQDNQLAGEKTDLPSAS